VLRGGYVARQESQPLALILMATGSELDLALQAAERLGPAVRVVSLPCLERFDRQTAEYREQVLPSSCQRRISIEAGVTPLWCRYVGPQGQLLGIDRFGLSAPGDKVLRELGMTVDRIVAAAQQLSNPA
jgi:transketolase